MLNFDGLSYKSPFIIGLFEWRHKQGSHIAFGGPVLLWNFSPISIEYFLSTTKTNDPKAIWGQGAVTYAS